MADPVELAVDDVAATTIPNGLLVEMIWLILLDVHIYLELSVSRNNDYHTNPLATATRV